MTSLLSHEGGGDDPNALPPEWATLDEWKRVAWMEGGATEYDRRLRGQREQEWLATADGKSATSVDDSDPYGMESEIRREMRRILVREEAQRRAAEHAAAEHASEWYGISGDVFDPDTPEPVPCVLEVVPGRYVFAPGITFLFGTRGSMKTWVAYQAILQEVRRGNCVLLLDYELSFEEAMRRLATLGATEEELRRVVYVQPSGAVSEAARAKLLERFASGPPSLVVIDSIGMAMGAAALDENSGSDIAKWAFDMPVWLKNQWPQAVILIIDHVTKGAAGGAATDPIGSQRKGAIADVLVNLRKLSPISRKVRGSGRATVQKDRKGFWEEGADMFDYEFGGGGRLALSAPDPAVMSVEFGKTANAKVMIAAYVGSHPDVKVEDARNALDIHPNDFTFFKESLVHEEVIIHESRKGLRRGPKWQEFMSENIVTDD